MNAIRTYRGDPKRQRGAVAVVFALLLPVLLGFTALAVDLARLHLTRVELENAADAAALGGALSLSDAGGDPYNWTAAEAMALTLARRNVADARPIQDATIETGYWNIQDPSMGLQPADTPGLPSAGDIAAVRVTLSISASSNGGPLKFFFAPLLGMAGHDVRASSVGVLPAAGGGTGIFPWVIGNCLIRDFWDYEHNCALKDENGDPLTMDVSVESIYHEDCMSGTWTTFWDQDNSVTYVRGLIDNGNPANITVGDSTWVQTGVEDALFRYEGIPIGEPVPVLVVDSVRVNSWQEIIAVAAFTIDEVVKIDGKSHIIGHLSDNVRFGQTDPGSGGAPPLGAYAPPVLVN